jgi:hypothetical protein
LLLSTRNPIRVMGSMFACSCFAKHGNANMLPIQGLMVFTSPVKEVVPMKTLLPISAPCLPQGPKYVFGFNCICINKDQRTVSVSITTAPLKNIDISQILTSARAAPTASTPARPLLVGAMPRELKSVCATCRAECPHDCDMWEAKGWQCARIHGLRYHGWARNASQD